MKYFYILFFFFSSLQNNFAQTNIYHPFPEDTATWEVSSESQYCNWVTNLNQNYCGSTIYLMSGDTIINAISYNKIYSKAVKFYYVQYPPNAIIGCGCSGNYSYSFAMRQDSVNKKVYCIDNTMTSDTLLYNFNLTIGDTLPLTFGYNLSSPTIVSSIDSILINSTYHKKFHLNNNWHSLIEGIGWDCDLRTVFYSPEYSYGLDCFDYNVINAGAVGCGILVTSNSEIENDISFLISPNPSDGNFIFKTSETNSKLSVTNILGEKIFETKITSEETKINLENSNNGIYFLQLNSPKVISREKIVINK